MSDIPTDTHMIMSVFAANTAGAYCGMCWERLCPHTAEGVMELSRMVNTPPPERAILTDLIAELRDAPDPHEYRGNYAHDCADDAEARLREVTGDE